MRSNSAGIPYTLLLRIAAIEFPAIGLLLYFFVIGFQDFVISGCRILGLRLQDVDLCGAQIFVGFKAFS